MIRALLRRTALAVVCISIFIVYAGIQRELVDDTLITFVYAKNFVQHGFPYWHPDLPPVDGFTSAGHMLALAGLHAMGLGLVMANSILVFGAAAAILWLYLGAVRDMPVAAQLGGAAIILLNSSFALWAGAGLDALPYTLAFFACYLALDRAIRLSRFTGALALALCALGLMRPEGQIIGLGIACFWLALLSTARVGQDGLWRAALAVGFIVGIFVVRMAIFGHPLPNTFYAKSGDRLTELQVGLHYVLGWILSGGGVIALATPIAVMRGSGGWLRALFIAGKIVLVSLAGGDSHPAFRFMLPVLPIIALDVAWLLARIEARRGAIMALLLAIYLFPQLPFLLGSRSPVVAVRESVASIAAGTWPIRELAHSRVAADRVASAREISSLFPPDMPIGATDVGAFAYGVEQPVIDLLGLNHPELAHLPKRSGQPVRWGTPRIPEAAGWDIPVFTLWFPARYRWNFSELLEPGAECSLDARMIATHATLGMDVLLQEYVPVSLRPPGAPDRWINIFVRRDRVAPLLGSGTNVRIETRLRDMAEKCALRVDLVH